MTKFLAGVLVGLALMFSTMTAVSLYDGLNKRLAFVEGYIGALDQMIRSQR